MLRQLLQVTWLAVVVPLALCSTSGCQSEARSDAAQSPDVAADEQDEDLIFEEADESPKAAKDEAATRHKKHKNHKANRLADETSPYLLMHAHNPVDWFPWGAEAFEKARRENKVIFLSVGYSSCYWCHVMERESFLDEEIAEFLNNHFVCIKVDREELPDVDDIYMMAVQLITGRGGWPMSVFLTPEAKPFYGGTYFPARAGDRGSPSGFLELIRAMRQGWNKDPDALRKHAQDVSAAIVKVLHEQQSDEPTVPTRQMVDNVLVALENVFDGEYGGFGRPPFSAKTTKFPSPSELLYLADRVRRGGDNETAKNMLTLTLDMMTRGGIRDHLGGGFHRYSVDRFWHIPHFEKMLYDNGQLASVYAEAFALTRRDDYRRVLVELLDFVLREMTDEAGGFYSAIDAETDAEEGKFYRWTKSELESVMIDDKWTLMSAIYGLAADPNFEHEGHGYYVPQLMASLGELAQERGLQEAALEQQLAPLRDKLLAVRNRRKRPLTDTKILTAWNGLMIRGFADAGRILDDERYKTAAARAADFVLKELQTDDNRLLRTYREGAAKLNAYLDDYAFLASGLIALHRATDDDRWLSAAAAITDKQIELFWDEQSAGFFFTSTDHETLIARAKKRTDNVLPSGNGVSAANLVYLAGALPDQHYGEYAEKSLGILAEGLKDMRQSQSMPGAAIATAAWLDLQE